MAICVPPVCVQNVRFHLTSMNRVHNSVSVDAIAGTKNGLLIKLFFHLILIKFGEVVVAHVYYNFAKFYRNRMKNKKVLLIAHLTIHPLRFC